MSKVGTCHLRSTEIDPEKSTWTNGRTGTSVWQLKPDQHQHEVHHRPHRHPGLRREGEQRGLPAAQGSPGRKATPGSTRGRRQISWTWWSKTASLPSRYWQVQGDGQEMQHWRRRHRPPLQSRSHCLHGQCKHYNWYLITIIISLSN